MGISWNEITILDLLYLAKIPSTLPLAPSYNYELFLSRSQGLGFDSVASYTAMCLALGVIKTID